MCTKVFLGGPGNEREKRGGREKENMREEDILDWGRTPRRIKGSAHPYVTGRDGR